MGSRKGRERREKIWSLLSNLFSEEKRQETA
jgi:hypothetical protein